jgi:hypothetical protein
LDLGWYTSLTTRNLSCTSFPFRVYWANFLWYLSATLELFRTACATPFRALPATAGRAQVMDAGCGSSTRGHWDGPVTCNKSHGIAAREPAGRKVPCEHGASPCLGHATVCSVCPLTILIGSLGSASARQTFGQICGSVASHSCSCGGSKTVLNTRFLVVPAKKEVHRPPGFRNVFAAIAASDVYECIPAVKPSICSHISLLCAGGTKYILLLLYQYYCYYINYSYYFIAVIAIMEIML